jgi:hypothetical protein
LEYPVHPVDGRSVVLSGCEQFKSLGDYLVLLLDISELSWRKMRTHGYGRDQREINDRVLLRRALVQPDDDVHEQSLHGIQRLPFVDVVMLESSR